MAKSKNGREEKVALYNKLVASYTVTVLKGAAIPYTSVNGNMYSYFSKDDFMALRLPEEERIKFLAKYKTNLVEQYGIIQKEYVTVPGSLLQKTSELKKHFAASYKYASSLKPKPTATGKKKK